MATEAALLDKKTEYVCSMIKEYAGRPIDRLLVVGCGSGIEAAILAKGLGTRVTGLDASSDFDARAAARVDLRQGDARALPFTDDSFDFVYCYHALEHIPEPSKAVREIARVLRTGGGYFIGTPNRTRLLGYVGSKTATMRQKIRSNVRDWRIRLTGRFRNEYGAHAGFTAKELRRLIEAELPGAADVSHQYYKLLYSKYGGLLSAARIAHLHKILYPSVYFMGVKQVLRSAASASSPLEGPSVAHASAGGD